MESAPKIVKLYLELNEVSTLLSGIANHYNYVTAKPLIDKINQQVIEQSELNKEPENLGA